MGYSWGYAYQLPFAGYREDDTEVDERSLTVNWLAGKEAGFENCLATTIRNSYEDYDKNILRVSSEACGLQRFGVCSAGESGAGKSSFS